MSSNSHSLSVLEQEFQNMLCAAFTIQQYNERKLASTNVLRGCDDPLDSVPDISDLHRVDDDGILDAAVLVKLLEEQFNESAAGVVASEGQSRETPNDDNRDQATTTRLTLDLDAAGEQIELFSNAGQLMTEHGSILLPSVDAQHTTLGDVISDDATSWAEVDDSIPNHVCQEVVDQAIQTTHGTGVAMALVRKRKLICRAAAGDSIFEIGVPLGNRSAFAGLCASSGRMQLCNNTLLDSRVDAKVCCKLGIRAIVVLPLFHNNLWRGLIAVFSARPYQFGMPDVQRLQDLAEKFTANMSL
jgi:hypothetical protein